jgi:hypothetical protein
MNAKEAKRIEAIDAAVLPQKIVSRALDTFELSTTLEDYLEGLPEESAGRKLAALTPDLKSSGSKGSKSEDRGRTMPGSHDMSQWYFITRLIAGLSSMADDLILLGTCRLQVAEMTWRIKGMVRVSEPTGLWIDGIDLGKFTALLVETRDDITSNLRELQASKLASEFISEKYDKAHKLLHQSWSVKIEELHKRTLECAQEYEHTLKELLAAGAPSGRQWPPDLCEIDFNAVEELAVSEGDERVAILETSAKAQMQIAFE